MCGANISVTGISLFSLGKRWGTGPVNSWAEQGRGAHCQKTHGEWSVTELWKLERSEVRRKRPLWWENFPNRHLLDSPAANATRKQGTSSLAQMSPDTSPQSLYTEITKFSQHVFYLFTSLLKVLEIRCYLPQKQILFIFQDAPSEKSRIFPCELLVHMGGGGILTFMALQLKPRTSSKQRMCFELHTQPWPPAPASQTSSILFFISVSPVNKNVLLFWV